MERVIQMQTDSPTPAETIKTINWLFRHGSLTEAQFCKERDKDAAPSTKGASSDQWIAYLRTINRFIDGSPNHRLALWLKKKREE